jgi:hypothetical protein
MRSSLKFLFENLSAGLAQDGRHHTDPCRLLSAPRLQVTVVADGDVEAERSPAAEITDIFHQH